MNDKTFNNDFIPYKVKKRFIVVSIWGCASDYGFMDVEEIEEMKNKMISASKYVLGDPVRVYARTNNIDDMVILCWCREEVK